MRWAGGFFAALVLALLFLSVALLYGANWYLRGGGGQIGELIRRYAPDAEVRFARAGLRLGIGTAALYAEDLFVRHGEAAQIFAPRADFWIDGGGGVVAVLHDAEIAMRAGGEDGGPPPIIPGEWAAEARRAKVSWLDADGVSLTLQNALLKMRGDNGRLQASIEESDDERGRELRVAADLRIDENGVGGDVELSAVNWPPDMLPSQWRKVRATIRAKIAGGDARISAGGSLETPAAARWRADGHWDGEAASLTVAVAVDRWKPISDAAPADAFWRGDLQYQKGGWLARGDIVAGGEDGGAGGATFARGDNATIADIDVDLRVVNAPARALWKYIPHAETREWMAESIDGGVITFARLRARGSPPHLETELTAAFSGGVMRIGEDWPAARSLHGIVSVARDGEVVIAGEGAIAGVVASSVLARIPAADAETPSVLHLRGAFERAPLTAYMAAARALPPAREEAESIARRLRFAGDARLAISLHVPLAAADDAEFYARLTILGNGEIAAADLPPLSLIAGAATIDGGGVRADLRGYLAGAPAETFADNEQIRIRGVIPAAVALSIAGVSAFTAADGEAEFELSRDERRTVFISDLRGVSLALPPPLRKAAAEIAPLRVEAENGGVRASLRLRGDEFVALVARANGGADVAINDEPRDPPSSGIYVHGTLRGFRNAEAWLAGGGGGGDDVGLSLSLIDAEILNMPRQNLTIYAPAPGADGARRIELNGDAADGAILYRRGFARASFSHLRLAALPGGDAAPDIRGLSLAASVNDLHIGDVALGSLSLRGAPSGNEWMLSSLRVDNGANIFAAGGRYDGARTELTVLLSAPDAAAALGIFGLDDVVSEGGATLTGAVSWSGAPPDFSLESAGGQVSLLAENLRYLRSEDGVIGFLAVFSPQSLLQLGFTEIGKEGVHIDTMRGEIALRGGAAEFRNIVMENKDLNISLRGETDLRARTLDISGRVRPGNRLLNAGSAAGIGVVASVQPVALAAGWFLGKIFEEPLSEIGAYDYTVTGAWSDPVYQEVGAAADKFGGKGAQ